MSWTVGKKLAAGFGLALLLLFLVAGVSLWSIGVLVETSSWVTHTHEVLENLESVVALLKDAETGERGFLLSRSEFYLQPYYSAREKLPKKVERLHQLTRDNAAQQQRLAALEHLIQEHLRRLEGKVELRKKDDPKDGLDVHKAKGLAETIQMMQTDTSQKQKDRIRDAVAEMEVEERQLLATRSQAQEASIQTARWAVVLGSLASLVALAVCGFVVTRGISRPLGEVTARSQQIAAGNLTGEKLPAGSADEIGQLAAAFNAMLDGLRGLARQTHAVTENLNAAAAQIQSAIQEQAAGIRQQASTVQEIGTTMEEISQSGAQISAKAKQVATAAEATSAAGTSGLQAVQGNTRNMGAIREQVEQVAEHIVALSEKTQAVGEIIATVNDVAERSNLLALNAAIEAAAAGDQGSRFSVVANEMKNLADQAKDSTVQVRTILGDIQKGINSSVMLTEEAVKRTETGKRQADVAEETIRQLARTTLESVQAFEQIIGAGNQQQIGVEQVAQGMKDIRQAATQSAAATAQMEKAVANLNALGRELREAVGRYQL
jgi:methyl-accepting chemotaxis protein